jgi:hypothetical protein
MPFRNTPHAAARLAQKVHAASVNVPPPCAVAYDTQQYVVALVAVARARRQRVGAPPLSSLSGASQRPCRRGPVQARTLRGPGPRLHLAPPGPRDPLLPRPH